MSARVSKFAYGLEVYQIYDSSNGEHKRRKDTTFMTPKGRLGIGGIFSVILPQVRCPVIDCVYLNLTLMFRTPRFQRRRNLGDFTARRPPRSFFLRQSAYPLCLIEETLPSLTNGWTKRSVRFPAIFFNN